MAEPPYNVLRHDTEDEESLSSHPFERFLEAKKRIDEYKGIDNPLDVLLSGWTRDERVEFAKWYSAERQKQRKASINAQRAKPAMTIAQYIEELKNVNFRDTKSIFSFVEKTQLRDWDPYPDPIVLGSDLGDESGVIYQLRSQLVDDGEPTSDLADGTAPSHALVRIRSEKEGPEYAFFLGVLEASLPPNKSSSGSRSSSSSIESATATRQIVLTPYRVCVDPVDRSIWLVLSESLLSLSTDDLSRGIPQDADTWSYLQTKAKGRPSFDTIQVASWNDFITLTRSSAVSRQIFSNNALETATRGFPKLFVPSATALEHAMTIHQIPKPKGKERKIKPKGKKRKLRIPGQLFTRSRAWRPFSKSDHEAAGASEPQSEMSTERKFNMSLPAVAGPSRNTVAPVS